MRERYGVITVGGDITLRHGGTANPVGLAAHVIDRPNAHKVVATFRSEERCGSYATRGQDGARRAAESLAAEWNAEESCNAPTSA